MREFLKKNEGLPHHAGVLRPSDPGLTVADLIYPTGRVPS